MWSLSYKEFEEFEKLNQDYLQSMFRNHVSYNWFNWELYDYEHYVNEQYLLYKNNSDVRGTNISEFKWTKKVLNKILT